MTRKFHCGISLMLMPRKRPFKLDNFIYFGVSQLPAIFALCCSKYFNLLGIGLKVLTQAQWVELNSKIKSRRWRIWKHFKKRLLWHHQSTPTLHTILRSTSLNLIKLNHNGAVIESSELTWMINGIHRSRNSFVGSDRFRCFMWLSSYESMFRLIEYIVMLLLFFSSRNYDSQVGWWLRLHLSRIRTATSLLVPVGRSSYSGADRQCHHSSDLCSIPAKAQLARMWPALRSCDSGRLFGHMRSHGNQLLQR